MVISNIQELKDFILNNELSETDINEIVRQTLKIWISKKYDKIVLVNMLEDFYNKYPNKQDRPLFLDVQNDNITIKDFGYGLIEKTFLAKNI